MFFFDYDKNDKDADLFVILNDLIDGWEKEVVEFKEANNDFDKNKIGQYFFDFSNIQPTPMLKNEKYFNTTN